MTKSQQRRNELRKKRIEAEAASLGRERRRKALKIAIVSGLVAILGVAIAFAGITGGNSSDPRSTRSSQEIERQLEEIPQRGAVLGYPDAPVTLVEFADLRCPYCKLFAEGTFGKLVDSKATEADQLPGIIDGPVRRGEVKIEFRNWPILDDGIPGESSEAARAALAASVQGHYWQFIENFYANQRGEGTAYVTDDFLRDVAGKAGVPDINRWEKDRQDPRWDTLLDEAGAEAIDLGLTGTPGFAIKVRKEAPVQVENVSDLEESLQEAIDRAR